MDYPKLFFGLLLCSLCSVFAIHSNIGLSPWGVFHQGISKTIGITFGQASIICSLIIIIIVDKMGLKIGLGTVFNMIFTGLFVDMFEFLNVVPTAKTLNQSIMMMCLSMFFNALGSYYYISCEMGCGPRDGLMAILTKKTRLPVGLVRGTIELSALLIGWKLGGQVGFGTVLYVFGIGLFVNGIYKMMKFNISNIHHRTLNYHLFHVMKG